MSDTDSLHFLTAVEADDQAWIDIAERRRNWYAMVQIAQQLLANDTDDADQAA